MAEMYRVFDYRGLRTLIGIIAITLPFSVTFLAGGILTSISMGYHVGARDIFVGFLFIVGSFLAAYNGKSPKEAWASKTAGLMAFIVALAPTAKDDAEAGILSILHFSAAVLLFVILTWFCLCVFRRDVLKKEPLTSKRKRRSRVYTTSGYIMIASMVFGVVWYLFLKDAGNLEKTVFWVEAACLLSFGRAWLVAGKILPYYTDDEDRYRMF